MSLRWDPAVKAELLKATASGHIMSGKVPASDYFDVARCIAAHIETLNEMINTYCRGFGSKEVHVMAMLWWCNEQGRHLCEDLQLLRRSDRQPNYDEVKAVVPVDITENRGAPTSPRAFANAALNSETRVKDSASQEKLSKVAAQLLNIGAWCGTPHGTVFLSSSELAYQWGWGHVCNLAHQNGKAHTAPHLKYVNSENSATIPCVDEVDVVHDLWVRRGKQDKTNYKLLVNEPATHSTMRQSLRLSNDEDTAPRLWRGATDFRSSALPYKENRTVESTEIKAPRRWPTCTRPSTLPHRRRRAPSPDPIDRSTRS